MTVFYHRGFWTLKNVGEKGGDPVRGIFLAAIWLAEAATIVGVAAWTAWRGISSQPFCETCNRWTTTEVSVRRLMPSGSEAKSLELLKAGELAALDDFAPAPAGAGAYLQLDLALCPTCQQSNFLSIYNCQQTVDKHGKPTLTKTTVLENLIIAADDIPGLRQCGRLPVAGEDAQLPDFLQSPPDGGDREKAD